MEQGNRESWLNRVAIGMVPLFDALCTPPLPSRVRVAIRFTSRARKAARSGSARISMQRGRPL